MSRSSRDLLSHRGQRLDHSRRCCKTCISIARARKRCLHTPKLDARYRFPIVSLENLSLALSLSLSFSLSLSLSLKNWCAWGQRHDDQNIRPLFGHVAPEAAIVQHVDGVAECVEAERW
jgi:hypothetical protein